MAARKHRHPGLQLGGGDRFGASLRCSPRRYDDWELIVADDALDRRHGRVVGGARPGARSCAPSATAGRPAARNLALRARERRAGRVPGRRRPLAAGLPRDARSPATTPSAARAGRRPSWPATRSSARGGRRDRHLRRPVPRRGRAAHARARPAPQRRLHLRDRAARGGRGGGLVRPVAVRHRGPRPLDQASSRRGYRAVLHRAAAVRLPPHRGLDLAQHRAPGGQQPEDLPRALDRGRLSLAPAAHRALRAALQPRDGGRRARVAFDGERPAPAAARRTAARLGRGHAAAALGRVAARAALRDATTTSRSSSRTTTTRASCPRPSRARWPRTAARRG